MRNCKKKEKYENTSTNWVSCLRHCGQTQASKVGYCLQKLITKDSEETSYFYHHSAAKNTSNSVFPTLLEPLGRNAEGGFLLVIISRRDIVNF